MNRLTGPLVALLLLLALAGCSPGGDEGPPAAPADLLQQPWEALEKRARGQEVRLFMWGGDPGFNRYIDDFAAPRLAERYGIHLERVPLDGTEAMTSKLLSEKQAGRQRGSADLLWVNGENFATGDQAGLWAADWACDLPNARLIDWADPVINRDFGYPVQCREAPWSQAHFVLIHDRTEVADPPTTPEALLRWARENPGRFTYPAPPDFTGNAFIKQMLLALSDQDFQRPFDPGLFRQAGADLWAYLNRLEPFLWREGATYPASVQKLNELFANGELAMTLSYNPQFARRQSRKGIFPETVRSTSFAPASLTNTSYLAIPFNAPHPAAALVAVNFLQSPEAQIAKQDPGWLGALSVLDPQRLTEADRTALAQTLDKTGLSLEQLRQSGNPEPYFDWNKPLNQGWKTHVARD